MASRRSPGGLVLVGGLIVLHFALRPLLTAWPTAPDLLSGALLLGALRLRAGHAAGLGFGLGLLEASMALKGMGALMIIYAIAGWAAAKSRDLLFSDSALFVPIFLFIGVWVLQVAIAAASRGPLSPLFGLLVAPTSAGLTAALCWIATRVVSYGFREAL